MRFMPVICLLGCYLGAGIAAVQAAQAGHVDASELPVRAERIISLAPHITELLFAVGAGRYLVGTVEHSDFPRRARAVTRIGDHQSVDFEAILALKPDLVLAWSGGSRKVSIEKLRRLGLPVLVIRSQSLADISSNLRQLAGLTGLASRGEEVATHVERLLDELRRQYGGRPEVTVFMQIWDRPLMTINGHHFISEVIELCGGRNVFAGLDTLVPTIGVEAVIEQDPEVIMSGGSGNMHQHWLSAWEAWPQLRAVRHGHLYQIESESLSRPTPRLLTAAKKLCTMLDSARKVRQGR